MTVFTNSFTKTNSQTMRTDSMDAEDYSFFLAYGMTQDDEAEDSLLNVEMYNMVETGTISLDEESYSTVFI